MAHDSEDLTVKSEREKEYNFVSPDCFELSTEIAHKPGRARTQATTAVMLLAASNHVNAYISEP
jgi:hypothetical protein